MKFGIWRHENSIGNSAEHTFGLALYLRDNNIDPSSVEIYVEHEFQKDFALCIEGVEEKNINFFEHEVDLKNLHPYFDDIYMPSAYGEIFMLAYDCEWDYLYEQKDLDVTLRFDDTAYKNKFGLPKGAIVVFHREHGTWDKRGDGNEFESNRFVDPKTFYDLAFHYANLGYKVVKIGDKYQKPLPGEYIKFEFGAKHEHPNIIDFTKYLDSDGKPLWTFKDYLFVLQHCKVFISCDAGIWPMVGAMKKNLLLCNVTCIFNYPPKPQIVGWLPTETTEVLVKNVITSVSDLAASQGSDRYRSGALESIVVRDPNGNPVTLNKGQFAWQDNSFEKIIKTAKTFLPESSLSADE